MHHVPARKSPGPGWSRQSWLTRLACWSASAYLVCGCDGGAAAPQVAAHDSGAADAGGFVIRVPDAGVHPQEPSGPCADTFSAVVRLVFVGARCTTSNCHAPGPDAPAAALDLTEHAAYRALVDVAPTAQVDSPWRRVTRGDEQTSLLYRKLAAAEPSGEALPANAGAAMPIGLPAVAPEHLAALRAWIRAGAEQTGVTPGTEDFVAACE
jgi:hypothetical protein